MTTQRAAVSALAGDVGGTNARLALVRVEGDTLRFERSERYPSHDYPGLGPIVRRFCREIGETPDRACFALAGPVVDGECHATNLPWTVSARSLATEIGVPNASIINDFDAAGHGLGQLNAADLVTLQPGVPVARGPIALIGAGTGLGEGLLVWDVDRYRVHSSEGGHVDFAPRNEVQSGLERFLRSRYGHASYERVLSGRGLGDVYRYLAEAGGDSPGEQAAVRAEMDGGADPAAVITRHAIAGTDALCGAVVAVFLDVLAAQAGNLALTIAATGGVYIAGGIAPRLIDLLRAGASAFAREFAAKGRMTEFLSRVPVRVVMNTDVGLLGAAAVATGRSG